MNKFVIAGVVGGVFLLIALLCGGYVAENNDAGYYIVKQAVLSGEMSVHKAPGYVPQNFGKVDQYKISDSYDFHSEPINVRFNDSSTADITGSIKFRLSLKDEDILKAHQDFRSYDAIKEGVVRQVVMASLKQSATFFGAEEIYSTRRSEFIDRVNDQIKDGIYSTTTTRTLAKAEDGDNFIRNIVNIKLDDTGSPVYSEISAFKIYGIEVIQFVINDINFDEKTDALIAKRKEAEQEKVVARANAERAKQDTITAMEQGKAKIAIAEADALIQKKTAVVNAQRDREVATEQALKAQEEKKKIIALGEADAESARLKVAAGLTPLERATIEKETAIGVAHELAAVKLPGLMVIGANGENGSALNPFDAVGLQAFIQMSKDMSKSYAIPVTTK